MTNLSTLKASRARRQLLARDVHHALHASVVISSITRSRLAEALRAALEHPLEAGLPLVLAKAPALHTFRPFGEWEAL